MWASRMKRTLRRLSTALDRSAPHDIAISKSKPFNGIIISGDFSFGPARQTDIDARAEAAEVLLNGTFFLLPIVYTVEAKKQNLSCSSFVCFNIIHCPNATKDGAELDRFKRLAKLSLRS